MVDLINILYYTYWIDLILCLCVNMCGSIEFNNKQQLTLMHWSWEIIQCVSNPKNNTKYFMLKWKAKKFLYENELEDERRWTIKSGGKSATRDRKKKELKKKKRERKKSDWCELYTKSNESVQLILSHIHRQICTSWFRHCTCSVVSCIPANIGSECTTYNESHGCIFL